MGVVASANAVQTHLAHGLAAFAFLAVALVVGAIADRRQRPARSAGSARPAGNADVASRRSRTAARTLLALTALAVAASGGVHLAVMPEHFGESALYGTFFLVTATIQVVAAGWLLVRPSRRLLAALAAGTASVLALWLFTRTVGIPLGPASGEVEAVGGLDLAASSLELVTLVGCALLARAPLPGVRRAVSAWRSGAVTPASP
jgi:hypothetical protein